MITRRGFLGFILAAPIVIKAKFEGWIPAEMPVSESFHEIDFSLINAEILKSLKANVIYDNLFKDDPMLAKLRSRTMDSFDGGETLNPVFRTMQDPFHD